MKTAPFLLRPCSLALCAILLFSAVTNGQSLQVDSVMVDSVWNSDSSWYDGNGVLYSRSSRDLLVSYTIRATAATVRNVTFHASFDAGNTWDVSPNPLRNLSDTLQILRAVNRRNQVRLRIFGGDRPNTVIKVMAGTAPIGGICPTEDSLTIVWPLGGEEVKVGSTLKIEWCHPEPEVPSVRVLAEVPGNSYEIDLSPSSINFPTSSYSWVVDSQLRVEDKVVSLVGKEIGLRIRSYAVFDITSPKVVVKVVR